MECNEKDWKLLRQKLPDWQESYMGKLIDDYKQLLNGDMIASEKFWKLDKRIKNDKTSTGVIVRNLRRSQFLQTIISLINDGVITFDD